MTRRREDGSASPGDRGSRFLLGEDGQATVEAALVLPLFVLLVLFVVQTGVVIRNEILTTHAAREAVRAAAVAEADRAEAAFSAARRAGPLDAGRLRVDTEAPGGDEQWVRVVVSYEDSTDIALIGALLPTVHHEASATMQVEPGRRAASIPTDP